MGGPEHFPHALKRFLWYKTSSQSTSMRRPATAAAAATATAFIIPWRTGDSAYLQYFPHSLQKPQCEGALGWNDRPAEWVVWCVEADDACSQVAENHFTQIADFTAD